MANYPWLFSGGLQFGDWQSGNQLAPRSFAEPPNVRI